MNLTLPERAGILTIRTREKIMETVFVLDADQLKTLFDIAARLQSGTDRERDEGHRLWLLVETIRNQIIEV